MPLQHDSFANVGNLGFQVSSNNSQSNNLVSIVPKGLRMFHNQLQSIIDPSKFDRFESTVALANLRSRADQTFTMGFRLKSRHLRTARTIANSSNGISNLVTLFHVP